jgi:8-oxo-dGTP pyrophosphatase MutT (NUDIX family)
MLHRSSKVAFGGMWVFPGGRVEEGDCADGAPLEDEASGQRAAAREAAEECGLVVDADSFVALSHWRPPPIQPKRFATWFFVARVPEGEVVVDGGEIHDHRWVNARQVLEQRDLGEVDLAPPTWVTLHDLTAQGDVDAALAFAASRRPVPHYVTHWRGVDGGAVAMWAGDAGYDDSDPDRDGPRHRLWMLDSGWRLERDVP